MIALAQRSLLESSSARSRGGAAEGTFLSHDAATPAWGAAPMVAIVWHRTHL
jgi:hypothetical protein